jgi:hypothetical protein
MTAGAFDRLLYTDCRAGTGRGSGGGFQVQAQSAGVDAAQSKMAIGWLLYDAPNAWIMQRRPVDEFPLGFAHAAEAGYGTAQSRYVGTEATGARQGNHLADCLLTRDLDLYGPTRPAQLWRSPLWRAEPWDSTDCPQFEETPPLGPLSVDAVAEWLRGRPERPAVLAKLLTVLEDPAGPRVVIAAAGPDEALRWIAAATLLLPTRAALDVSFKVFCSNPTRVSHRIAAVPKELNQQVVPGRVDPAFILDAEQAISDAVEASERARFWVGQFASAEDPYDVVDAVELAESLDPGIRRGGTDALVSAWAVTVPDRPLAEPAALFRWLSGADPKLQYEYGPPVVRRILAADPPAATLRWIDTAGAEGRIDVDRGAVRATLLTAEIAEVAAGGFPFGEVLADVDTDASTRRDADSELSSAILLGSDPQVDLLLCLSRRHGIDPRLSPLKERLGTFALGWIDNPARDYSPDRWALRDEILDMAHEQLHGRLAQRGAPGIMDTLLRLWRYFIDRAVDLADPLDCHVQVAAIRALPGKQRPSRLSELTQQARLNPKAEDAIAGIQLALIEWRALGPAEALVFLPALPSTVPVAQEVLDVAVDEIRRAARRPTAAALNALGALHRHGIAPQGQPFDGLLAADLDVRDFVEATRDPRFQEDIDWGRRWVKKLGRADPAVLHARLGTLLQACLEFAPSGLGAPVLRVLRPPQRQALIELWGRELGRSHAIRAAIEGLCWHEDSALPDDLRSLIADMLGDFASAFKPADRERWFLQVRDKLNPEYAKAWTRLVGPEEARPRRGLRFRGKDA